jgi:hypothetical protein
MNAPTPPLHAALQYSAGKLLIELDRTPTANDSASLVHHLTPTTRMLLHWWFSGSRCSTRVDNFHIGQREAILHTVLMHELMQTEDPARLLRLTSDPCQHLARTPGSLDRPARYDIRMAPGLGLRWVMQALMIWQWANHAAADTDEHDGARFSDRLTLVAATPDIQQRLSDAWLGPVAATGQRDTGMNSLMRHAGLFLPASMRQPFFKWVAAQPPSGNVLCAHDTTGNIGGMEQALPVITLIAGSRPYTIDLGTSDPHGHRPSRNANLHVSFYRSKDAAISASGSTLIADFPMERAIRNGAAKLPMLEPTHRLRLPAVRSKSMRHRGLRPRLPRAYRSLLQCGLQVLAQRESSFTAVDPTRHPKLLVLCDTPRLLPCVRRFLMDNGIARDSIVDAAHCRSDGAARVVLDTFHAAATLAEAPTCVIVALRMDDDTMPQTIISAGAPRLWPEPDFAALRSENRERIAQRRAPDNLIDVLSIVEHPQHHHRYSHLIRAGLAIRVEASSGIDATGDLFTATLRPDAAAYQIAMPPLCGETSANSAETMADVSRCYLRKRQMMRVHKSIYTHSGWSLNDNGLRRAFLECAECDPQIESHWLIDRRRYGAGGRERQSAQDSTTYHIPDALVRTAQAIYLVDFIPFYLASPRTSAPSADASAQWPACANKLPAARRQGRLWYRVALQAPLFWSWKRADGMLSTLLASLAEGVAEPHPISSTVASE